jgi:hypothetical protein
LLLHGVQPKGSEASKALSEIKRKAKAAAWRCCYYVWLLFIYIFLTNNNRDFLLDTAAGPVPAMSSLKLIKKKIKKACVGLGNRLYYWKWWGKLHLLFETI